MQNLLITLIGASLDFVLHLSQIRLKLSHKLKGLGLTTQIGEKMTRRILMLLCLVSLSGCNKCSNNPSEAPQTEQAPMPPSEPTPPATETAPNPSAPAEQQAPAQPPAEAPAH